MNSRIHSVACVVASLVTASVSFAEQPWLQDRRYREGVGLRTGDFEWHPGVGTEFGYDSNYLQGSDQEDPPFGAGVGSGIGEPQLNALRLQVIPSVSVATLGPQRKEGDEDSAAKPLVDFRSSASFTYNEIFWLADEIYTDQVTQERNISADVGARLTILPERPWGGDLAVSYQRVGQPSNDYAALNAFDRNSLAAGLGLAWRPGGGLLDWRLGYDIGTNFFDNASFARLNNLNHDFSLQGNWRFLPRTAVLYRGRVGVRSYNQPTAENAGGTSVSSSVGLNGLLTDSISLLGLVGWKSTFYNQAPQLTPEENPNFDGLIATAELNWYPLRAPEATSGAAPVGLSTVTLGYNRDAFDSYLGNYYQQDRVYLRGEYFLGGVFLFSLEGGYAHLLRPPAYFQNGESRAYYDGLSDNILTGDLEENRIDAVAFAEYRFLSTMAVNLTGRANAGVTDAVVQIVEDADVDPNGRSRDNLKFTRFEAFLGVRWFM